MTSDLTLGADNGDSKSSITKGELMKTDGRRSKRKLILSKSKHPQAKAVLRMAVPELIRAVEYGEISIPTARQLVRLYPHEQRQIVADGSESAIWWARTIIELRRMPEISSRHGQYEHKHAERPPRDLLIQRNTVMLGNCIDLIPYLEDDSVSLCLCSPPYAEQRKHQYGGVPEEQYPDFTAMWMRKLERKLRDDGSVIIVIDPHVKAGVQSDYVLKTELALIECGWKRHQTQIWLKRDRGPLGHNQWPRHCYEQILWFSKSARPFCDPRMSGKLTDHLTMNNYAQSRWTNGGKPGKKGIARVPNVWDIPVGGTEKGVDHPAKFSVALPKALIQTFCPPGGVVLDNFAGSGSTLIAAKQLGCSFYGFDIMERYVKLAQERLAEFDPPALPEAG